MRVYPSDLTDEEWVVLRSLLPPAKKRGRPRRWPMRKILNGVFYVVRGGVQWRMLPQGERGFPPWQTVYWHFREWKRNGLWFKLHTALRKRLRVCSGRNADASAAIVDSQSVKTTEMGGTCGFDIHKRVKGRKRHLLVDTEGLVLSAFVSAANVSDQRGMRWLLSGKKHFLPRLRHVWADGAYGGQPLARWCQQQGGWRVEVVPRKKSSGFEVLPRRWVVERTFAWLGTCRRLAKDYERRVQTSEALILVAMTRLMVQRLARLSA